jgi:RNA recognition motif-containing protein
MTKKIYVGNLPYTATEEDLREAFERIGEVLSVRILTDTATGRSRGFGFVEMASDAATEKAIKELNGAVLKDRTLTVNEARPQARGEDRGRKGRPFDRGRGSGYQR